MTTQPKKAILLVNTGTPDAPTKKAVRHFISQFLNDKYVITIPKVMRKILVDGIIIPSRITESTKRYQQLWTEKGSPLLFYTKELALKLQKKIPDRADVFFAMRYGNPSIANILQEIQKNGYQKLQVIPLFPQYATSTTETIIQEVKRNLRRNSMAVCFRTDFYSNDFFVDVWAKKIVSYNPEKYDHILFSYHGLPNSHLRKIHPKNDPKDCPCKNAMPIWGEKCYRASCYQTTRLITEKLGLQKDNFSNSFQSRLNKNWTAPFTDEVLTDLAKNGQKVLVVSPSFVADCFETNIELGKLYKELFYKKGGKEYQWVESLNASDEWVDALEKIIDF